MRSFGEKADNHREVLICLSFEFVVLIAAPKVRSGWRGDINSYSTSRWVGYWKGHLQEKIMLKCGPENLGEEKTAKPVRILVRFTSVISRMVFINISHNNFYHCHIFGVLMQNIFIMSRRS